MAGPRLDSAARAGGRRRILALCLGGIGDTVLAFAALRDLRRACPNDRLDALAMWPQSAELLSDLGLFDSVRQHNFQCDRAWRSLQVAWQVRREGYDVSLLAFPANRVEYNALARLIGTPRRYGHTYLRGHDLGNGRFLLTDRIAEQRGRHAIDENRALVAAFTGHRPTAPADIRLGRLEERYQAYAERMFAHLDRPLLGIHAGCTIYKGHAAKRWPVERFAELCRRVGPEQGLQPVLFGMPDEIDLKLAIQAACPQAFIAHGPSIRHTAAMIARCRAFVSNDSGLAHIASAVDVPVVMICGPTPSWSVWPATPRGCVVEAGLPCSPCFLVGRQPVHCTQPIYQACLKAISVERVLEAVSTCLQAPSSSSSVNTPIKTAETRGRLPVLRASA